MLAEVSCITLSRQLGLYFTTYSNRISWLPDPSRLCALIQTFLHDVSRIPWHFPVSRNSRKVV